MLTPMEEKSTLMESIIIVAKTRDPFSTTYQNEVLLLILLPSEENCTESNLWLTENDAVTHGSIFYPIGPT